jgi:3-methylcrotonyl-CoA carboxylase beta subunit
VGILANDGILFSETARKAAHFIQLCEQRDIPLVFLQNITGFMVGKEYEHGGIARDGAKMVTAVACASVPKYTVVLGGSFGAGNYGMCGRAYQPRLMFMWPESRISVMGPEQAASVLTQVRADSYKARGKEFPEAEATAYRQEIEASYNAQASAYYATARLWDDGMIDPLDTRTALSLGISAGYNAPRSVGGFGVFRM